MKLHEMSRPSLGRQLLLRFVLVGMMLLNHQTVVAFVTPLPKIQGAYHHASASAASAAVTPSCVFRKSSTTSLHALSDITSSAGAMGSMIDQKQLINFFLMKLIENGVPASFTILTILIAARAFRAGRDNDDMMNDRNFAAESSVSELYDDLYGAGASRNNKSAMNFLSLLMNNNNNNKKMLPLARNVGIPKQQFISVTNWNEKLDSYDYNMKLATQSKASAAAMLRSKNFDRAILKSMTTTTTSPIDVMTDDSSSSPPMLLPHEKQQLLQSEETLLQKGKDIMASMIVAETQLTDMVLRQELEQLGITNIKDALDPVPTSSNSSTATATATTPKSSMSSKLEDRKKYEQQLMTSQRQLMDLETSFLQNVTQVLGSQRAVAFRAAILGDVATRGRIGQILRLVQDRPLSLLLQSSSSSALSTSDDSMNGKSVYVIRFPGDVQASQVAELREEVTAIVRTAKPGDEVVLVLQSGGGTVTGYGLAAGQLQRFKEEAGMKLTICVEQVAASGGYMMCCVADRIVASPMAVLGSIGVITDIPNVYERLNKEGIEFQTVTAGKYKRTLTPTKKVTKEDLEKTKQEIEKILVLFKGFVKSNRPSLDIDAVATGETWFGMDAMDRGLCDEIKTTDSVLLEYVNAGANVYEINYEEPPVGAGALGQFLPGRFEASSDNGWMGRGVQWLVRTIVAEVQASMTMSGSVPSTSNQYMLQDDSKDRLRLD